MKFPLYWVDAFTPKVFAGNPAGVVPLAAWPADAVMQQIAFENGLAETAFFVRTGAARLHLRWFTPELEMDLCGHATLASAFVVFTQLGQAGERIVFDSLSGPLTVTRRGALFELDFPSRPAAPLAPAQIPPPLRPGLGGPAPQWIGKARDYLCVYATADEVRALRPDFSLLNQIDVIGIIATAPGDGGVDFVSRFFCPNCAVPEDPVTGSAHCTLIPHWAERLGKTTLHARQISARGGELFCELAGDRVKIAGHAVLYLRGEIEL
ncbi:MAG: PhzF family phenazine biosynthesis protein [Opitutae bacterium]|nr:PhzF family phenazine biosynthesis protein [Opitutae bacterium]